jgi:cbb3-type cytochrome oxidase subunit 3
LQPSAQPTSFPTNQPSAQPSRQLSSQPSTQPSSFPSAQALGGGFVGGSLGASSSFSSVYTWGFILLFILLLCVLRCLLWFVLSRKKREKLKISHESDIRLDVESPENLLEYGNFDRPILPFHVFSKSRISPAPNDSEGISSTHNLSSNSYFFRRMRSLT